MGENGKSEHWLVSGLGGVNILTLGTVLVAVVWAFAQGHFGQNQAKQRIELFEATLSDINKNFEDIENQIDALRQTNTEIAIIKLTSENSAVTMNRMGSKLDTLQEHHRDLQAEVRDIRREVERILTQARETK